MNKSLKQLQLQKYSLKLADKIDVHVLAGFSEMNCNMLVTRDKELLREVTKARTTRQTLELLLEQ